MSLWAPKPTRENEVEWKNKQEPVEAILAVWEDAEWFVPVWEDNELQQAKQNEIQQEHKKEDRENEKDIAQLKEKLSSSVFADVQENFTLGMEKRKAMHGNETAIQNEIDRNSYENYKDFSNALVGIRQSFGRVLTESEDELKEDYANYFEPQESKYYIWALLVAVSHKAYVQGFFAEHNNKENPEIDDNLKKEAEIIQKIVDIKNKIRKENTPA